jgi:uncharacterized protein (DUF58 family)
MLPREVLRQIRRLQLKARRAVENLLGGEYHSIFKGAGIAFEEVRAYQPGDDVRAIDWNVTARMGQPFVKRYIEERERTVVLPSPGSTLFGTRLQQARGGGGVGCRAGLQRHRQQRQGRAGAVHRQGRARRPAAQGTRHVLRLIRDVLFYQPRGIGTASPRRSTTSTASCAAGPSSSC